MIIKENEAIESKYLELVKRHRQFIIESKEIQDEGQNKVNAVFEILQHIIQQS